MAATNKKYPEEHSIVEVVYVDGTTVNFMVNAGPSLSDWLASKLKETNSLVLRNDVDALVIPREQLRSFHMRKVTDN